MPKMANTVRKKKTKSHGRGLDLTVFTYETELESEINKKNNSV